MPSIAYNPSKTALFAPQEGLETEFSAGGHYSDAQLCVEAARLAYLHAENDTVQKAKLVDSLGRVGFGEPTLFWDKEPDKAKNTGTQAFGAFRASDGTALIAFRGTQPDEAADIGADLKATLHDWTDASGKLLKGRVHDGFASRLHVVEGDIKAWLDSSSAQRKRLLLCGHSLGAALATLAASIWHPDALVTIGSPRVGDADFVAALAHVNSTRFVNCCDLITQVPPDVPPFYVHLGPQTYIERHGMIQPDADDSFVFNDHMKARVAYIVQEGWKVGTVLVRDLADHAPINYVRALFP